MEIAALLGILKPPMMDALRKSIRKNVGFLLLLLVWPFSGCRSYFQPRAELSESDRAGNYAQVFREPVPPNVSVINFGVASYTRDRNGDWIEGKIGEYKAIEREFELIVPRKWIQKKARRFSILKRNGDFAKSDAEKHRKRAQPWYAPKSLDQYELYSDASTYTSIMYSTTYDAYVHMFVQKELEPDGRWRVFFSTEHIPVRRLF